MASLLHHLLFDLRQRCLHLLARLDSDKGTLEAEAEQYRDSMTQRVVRTGQLIDQLLADPGIQVIQLAKNYYHDYKRLAEMIQWVEEGPAVVLGRFNDDDLVMTRVVARICQEIGYRYRPPICTAMSAQYYWALPHMDLIFVPCSEPFHLLALADLYHELAHFILFRDQAALVAPAFLLIDQHYNAFVKDATQMGWPAASVTSLEIQRRNWKRNWYLEFASDMLATYCVGPAFGWANLRLCTNLSVELFVGADTHPADDARTTAIGLTLNRVGCVAEAQAISARWAELLSLSGQQMPQEHALAYPDKLLESLADFVHDAAKQLGLVSWSGGQSGAPTHVGALLNEAWRAFHLHPDTFAEYENREYGALRTDLGVTV
jgi:hypothetical protein